MRTFSFRPSLTIRGRTFKGLRGWAGKPLHPPVTDVPVGAYTLVAAFDVISFFGATRNGPGTSTSRDRSPSSVARWCRSSPPSPASGTGSSPPRRAARPAAPSLAYDYGFNVETSGDHPVWHPSEVAVFAGEKH